MKTNLSFFNVLGIAGALSLPAVVVAQAFPPRTVLSSTALQQLESRVTALEGGMGPTVLAATLTANATTGAIAPRNFRSQAAGIVSLVTAGEAVERTSITAAKAIDGTQSRIGRTTAAPGIPMNFPVGAAEAFSIQGQATGAGGQSLAASLLVYWTPLKQGGPAPL